MPVQTRRGCVGWIGLQAVMFGWLGLAALAVATPTLAAQRPAFSIAPFQADVTIPLNHRCMGLLPTKSARVDDPLDACGFVLFGGEKPVVFLAMDWCEIRNGAYDQWRDRLAQAAGTDRDRVFLSCLHQHDAPVTDNEAQDLLDEVGLPQELFDRNFQDTCIDRVCQALTKSAANPLPCTHYGIGQARVAQVASTRRVENPDGSVQFGRGSRSGADAFFRTAPEGAIDPFLKTLSFWNETTPLVALHAYATHPMSYYGQGGVSADFVGLARRMRSREQPRVAQIYVSGCSGDVTAGKYNDGDPGQRQALALRLAEAMAQAWESTQRLPLSRLEFRSAELKLDYHPGADFTEQALRAALQNTESSVIQRISAAMGLSSRLRVDRGQATVMPCLDLGSAQVVLFPGETFVAFQHLAQQLRPDSFVMCIGYGESWTGYIPTDKDLQEGFDEGWRWVAPGSEAKLRGALEKLLLKTELDGGQ